MILCKSSKNGHIFGTFSECMGGKTFIFTVKNNGIAFYNSDENVNCANISVKGTYLTFGNE